MVSNSATREVFTGDAQIGTDGRDGVEELLKGLVNMDLARRIEDAARIAMAKHICRDARLVQSAVEAENSAELA